MDKRINMKWTDEKKMMSESEASVYVGLGRSRIRQFCNEIGATRRIGRRVLYDKFVIDRYIDNMGDTPFEFGNVREEQWN